MGYMQAITDKAKTALKAELPKGWKFTVRTRYYSGVCKVDLTLRECPADPLTKQWNGSRFRGPMSDYNGQASQDHARQRGHAQLNYFQLRNTEHDYNTNGYTLTPEAWAVLAKATEIILRDHWDHSDIQVDYFNTNFYLSVNIGEWNKPVRIKPA